MNVPSREERFRALVIEDDPFFRDWVREVLWARFPRIEVMTLSDGGNLLKVLRTGRFDFILLDLQMPGVNGFQILEFLQGSNESNQTPVVIVSGLDSQELRESLSLRGYGHFLTKPIRSDALIGIVEEILRCTA